MADGAQRRAGRHDGVGLTRLSDRHIAHGIPGQKCRDLTYIYCGADIADIYVQPGATSGIIVSAVAALAIGSDTAAVPSMSTPGRSRTDTGDPFRGPASSLGLRGRIHNTARAIA
mgnify:CR=1 FL=1